MDHNNQLLDTVKQERDSIIELINIQNELKQNLAKQMELVESLKVESKNFSTKWEQLRNNLINELDKNKRLEIDAQMMELDSGPDYKNMLIAEEAKIVTTQSKCKTISYEISRYMSNDYELDDWIYVMLNANYKTTQEFEIDRDRLKTADFMTNYYKTLQGRCLTQDQWIQLIQKEKSRQRTILVNKLKTASVAEFDLITEIFSKELNN
jgi:hypothetical protein